MPWMRHFTKRSFNQFVRILETMNSLCEKKQKEHIDTYDHTIVRDITDSLIKATHEVPAKEKEVVGLTDVHIMTTLQELIGKGFVDIKHVQSNINIVQTVKKHEADPIWDMQTSGVHCRTGGGGTLISFIMKSYTRGYTMCYF